MYRIYIVEDDKGIAEGIGACAAARPQMLKHLNLRRFCFNMGMIYSDF
ncbi:MAG: hypothetical protein ACI4KL_02015 [Lentihominibacter sp.]